LRDEELLKVPRDVRPFDGRPGDEEGIRHQGNRVVVRGWKSGFQPIENRMRSFAIHNTLLHKNQFRLVSVAWSDVLQVLKNLISVAVLLMTKLITGKSQDNKLLAKLVGKRVHLGVIPGGRASQRGDVLDEDDFPLKHVHLQLGSGETATCQRLCRQVVKGLEGGPRQAHHDDNEMSQSVFFKQIETTQL